MDNAIVNSLIIMWNETLAVIGLFLPKIIATIIIFIIGILIAKAVKHLVIKVLDSVRLSSAVQKTPVQHFFDNQEVGQKIEDVAGNIVYWLIMLAVIHTILTILGLTSLSILLERIFGYLPKVISATVVLFFGVLIAGVVESVVKGAIKSIDGRSARLFGKISSYLVVTVAILAAVSELGIAKDFILILFIGFVSTVSIGLSLALGLGGQHVVREILDTWYKQIKKDIEEK